MRPATPSHRDSCVILVCPNPAIIFTTISPKYVEYPVKKIILKEHIQTEATIQQVSLHIFLFFQVGLYASVFLSS